MPADVVTNEAQTRSAGRWGRAARILTDRSVALATFVAALLAYLSNVTSLLPPDSDSVPNVFLAASVLEDGDLAYSPFEAPFMFVWSAKGAHGDVIVHVMNWNEIPVGSSEPWSEHYQAGRLDFRRPKYYLVQTVRERASTGEPLFVSAFGPFAGLTAIPFAVVARWAGVRLYDNVAATWVIAKLTAAVLAAASVAFFYLIVAGYTSRARALLLAGAYAVGTCIWTVSAQSLWQQTPEIFFLSLGLYYLLRDPVSWAQGAAAGLAFSLAAACRPTAAMVAVAAATSLFICNRRAFAAFALAAIPATAAMLAYNMYYFGSPLEFGQVVAGTQVAQFKTGSPDVWQTPLWLGAAGLLVSPSRGLLIYSPFLAIAFAGAVVAWKDQRYRSLRFITVAVPALWVPAFLWFDWWGGWTYGYRPIVDSVPLLALLCVPALGWVLARPVWRAAFLVSLAWSVFVQGLGAFVYAPWTWNMRVVDTQGTRGNIDLPAYRYRLWSLRDSQIVYLIANFKQARLERRTQIAY